METTRKLLEHKRLGCYSPKDAWTSFTFQETRDAAGKSCGRNWFKWSKDFGWIRVTEDYVRAATREME